MEERNRKYDEVFGSEEWKIIKANHPDISVGALKSALAQTTLDAGKPGHDVFHGRGWVNALKACNY